MTKQKRIAITGATGHLGTCLIQQLLSQNYFVNALFFETPPNNTHKNLTWIEGNITNKNAIKELIANCEVIIHAASIISIGNKKIDEIYTINVEGTETVINECLKKENIRFIYISSSNAVKESEKNEIFDENRPYKTSSDFAYGFTKATAEQLVLNFVKKYLLDAIIIRPTSIVGPPDYKPSLLGQTILDLHYNKLPAITTGGYNLVDVRDISNTIINGIELGEKGSVYLVGGEYITVKNIALTASPKKIPLQISLNWLLFFMPVINIYQKIFKLKWPITKESIQILKLAPKNMSFEKAINELNHKYRPAKTSIEDFIEWSKNTKI